MEAHREAREAFTKTAQQLAEEKGVAMSIRVKALVTDGKSEDELKKMCNEIWEKLVLVETEKYDLEERKKRQDYDVS
jgi:hypothetical protein